MGNSDSNAEAIATLKNSARYHQEEQDRLQNKEELEPGFLAEKMPSTALFDKLTSIFHMPGKSKRTVDKAKTHDPSL